MTNKLTIDEFVSMRDEALETFDYETAEKIYNFLDWKWVTSDVNVQRVPTAIEIRVMAKDLLDKAFLSLAGREGTTCLSCGGLYARIEIHKDYESTDDKQIRINVCLQFVPVEADSAEIKKVLS